MKGGQPLSALVASLLAELAQSGAEAERRQRSVYAELAAVAAVPAEVHEERAAGTADHEQAIAEAHLARLGLRTQRARKDVFLLDEQARQTLVRELTGVAARVDGADLTIDDVLQNREADRRTLLAFVTAALRRDARRNYLQTQTLLREGLPHATITGGRLTTKVILDTAEDGSVVAELANEKTATKAIAGAISELTFDFALGTYPTLNP